MWTSGNSHAASFAAPAEPALLRSGFTRIVAIGKHNDVPHLVWKIETAQPGCRERSPCRESCSLHGGETGLDAFAHQEQVARRCEAHGATAARAKHHLLRFR